MDKEPIFPNGLIFKTPRENAPNFILGAVSIKVDEFIAFLQENQNNGWVNIDQKKSKGGKIYFQLNDWKPKTSPAEHMRAGMVNGQQQQAPVTQTQTAPPQAPQTELPQDDIVVQNIPF